MAVSASAPSATAAVFVPSAATRRTLANLLGASGVAQLDLLSGMRAQLPPSKSPKHLVDPVTNTETSQMWLSRMKNIMEEVDRNTQCIPADGYLRLLDLGCCPGGFTSYILGKNGNARGVGVSLETEKGGHDYALEQHLRRRHTLIFADLLAYDLSPDASSAVLGFAPLPRALVSAQYNLVLLDGHYLDTGYHPSAAGATSPKWDVQRLLVAQVVTALQAITTGGTVIIKLGQPEHHLTARVLWMLDMLSSRLVTYKPRTMHASKNMFYAVAFGVGKGRNGCKMNDYWMGFRKLWLGISTGGKEGNGRWMMEHDLDFLISVERLEATYKSRLMQLGKEVWKRQAEALFAKACREQDMLESAIDGFDVEY